VQVVVQAPQALRRQIASTVRAVNDVDSHGCPIEHPVAAKPQWRPADPVDLASLTGVSAVSACRYSTDKDYWRGLISALRLSGAAAAAAVQGAAAAPIGGGPNTPQKCAPEVRYGDEIILLRVQSSAGLDEVVLRFDGCDHRGFDDGVRVRTLTATSVAPFVAGQNQVNDVSGSGMMGILRPEECPPPASSGQVVPSGDSSSPTGSTVC
jgi:hypothetical protein